MRPQDACWCYRYAGAWSATLIKICLVLCLTLTHAWAELARTVFAALGLTAANDTEDLENYSDAKGIVSFMRYYGLYEANVTLSEIQDLFNPYRYGHPTEVSMCPRWL